MDCRSGALVLLADLDALPASVLERHACLLSESERQRLERFTRVARRRQFIAGRVLLRRALGRLLDVKAHEVILRERPGQAPALDWPGAGSIGLSISHSGRWVACAASLDTALGLDIECIDGGRDVLALAEHAFAPDQVAALRACGETERLAEFYRMWCTHEAGIKLGQPVRALYPVGSPGLAGVLACASPLALPPSPTLVSLAEA